MGTLNYMSPEAILGGNPAGGSGLRAFSCIHYSSHVSLGSCRGSFPTPYSTPTAGGPSRGSAGVKVGRPSDIWSLGCILYQMVYGKTPFAHLPFIQKMHAIIDGGHQIAFPPLHNAALVDVMQRCLDRDARSRITMQVGWWCGSQAGRACVVGRGGRVASRLVARLVLQPSNLTMPWHRMFGPLQELLDHPFLRPTAVQAPPAVAPAPAAPAVAGGGKSVELSKEQLHRLLLKASQAGVSDVSQLSEQLFAQLYHGHMSPEVAKLGGSAAAGMAVEAGPQAQQEQRVPHRRPLLPLNPAGFAAANPGHGLPPLVVQCPRREGEGCPAPAASGASHQPQQRQPEEGQVIRRQVVGSASPRAAERLRLGLDRVKFEDVIM